MASMNTRLFILLVVLFIAFSFEFKSSSVSPSYSLKLLRGGIVYNGTQKLGAMDILFGGGTILQMTPSTSKGHQISIDDQRDQTQMQLFDQFDVEVFDVHGLTVIPGFVDVHMHVTGGGGEQGPSSRTPEARIDEIIEAGTTTICGLLGTDSISRSLPNLLTKLESLEIQGLSTFMWTGAYRVPVPTITGDIMQDITLIQKVIGIAETAISDQRSNWPSQHELERIISQARVAGMLSGKAGKVHFHVGSYSTGINPLFQVANSTAIPITQMYPTHMSSRGQALLNQGKQWIAQGGFLDFTADDDNSTDTIDAIIQYFQSGVDMTHVSLSTDAYGSLPVFDDQGNVISYTYGKPDTLLKTLKELVLTYNYKLEQVLQICTWTPASFLGLPNKGSLSVGYDADMVVLDSKFNVLYVFAGGKMMKSPTYIQPPVFPCL
mmetsp:Transcript_28842/g.40613  ORF Transcript_28842/g.40613 Transcript_28842/m.40613 type:complete len:435 (-) Transcript_28842:330-1634(-)